MRADVLLRCLIAIALISPLASNGGQHAAIAAAQTERTDQQPPEITAAAAFALDITAAVDLYDLNADERRAAGSTIKIATALVVRQHADLDDEVVVVAADLVEPGYSSMELIVGDTLTVEQLLIGLLVPSGGDAAQALGRHVGADLLGQSVTSVDPDRAIDRFVEEMNGLSEQLELRNTNFVNPDGRDADGQYTSARDLATIATAVLADEVLREIVALPSYDFLSPGGNQYTKANTNELLDEPGVIGVKTGSERQAGGCLVLAVEVGRNEVITVVLGSDLAYDEVTEEKTVDTRYDDTLAILRGLETDYVWVEPTDPDAVPGLAEALDVWQVTLRRGPSLVMPAADGAELTFRLRLGPPGEPEQEVGRVLFFVGSEQVGERPLYQAASTALAA